MSHRERGCPDWRAATAWRDGDGPAPPAWAGQLEHLAGCPACRRRVAALDPTLLLAAAAPVAEIDAAESRRLADTVRALVASRRLERRSPDRRALLAVAALLALVALPVGWRRLSLPAPAAAPVAAAAAPPPAAGEPLIEEVLPAEARIYQFGSDELPVVLIVDENLDL